MNKSTKRPALSAEDEQMMRAECMVMLTHWEKVSERERRELARMDPRDWLERWAQVHPAESHTQHRDAAAIGCAWRDRPPGSTAA